MNFQTMTYLLTVVLLGSVTFWNGGMRVSANDAAQRARDTAPEVLGSASMEMLSHTEGVDFRPYLHEAYIAVKKQWLAKLPPSVREGERGVNSVEVRIERDGNVGKDFFKVTRSSGKDALDAASLEGIRSAAPFGKLPQKSSQPFIELRFTFYYNLEPTQR
jgi:TonB family protein